MSLKPKMDFECLLRLQDRLDIQLFLDQMTWSQYDYEWRSLLHVAGYTLADYELSIDRRWDYLFEDSVFDLWKPTPVHLLH